MEFLTRSWKNDFANNVVAIIDQRDPRSENGVRQIKVMRSKDGKQRSTVLQPLRFQKIETIDDGVRNRTYFPDDREIIDDESLSKVDQDFSQRIDLAKRNYTFEIASRPRIAGRAAMCITATPKNSEMDLRRYYLDEATAYPLRAETVARDGEVTTIFDTKVIYYPSTLDADTFKLQSLPNVHVIKYTRPKTYSRAQIKAQVGFTPFFAQSLPYGFKIQEIQYSQSNGWSPVRIRVYDGLARATIYQWIPGAEQLRAGDNSSSLLVNGIKVMIVSDMNPRVRQRLLDAFVGQGRSEGEARTPFVRNERETEPIRGYLTFTYLETPLGICTQPIGIVSDPFAPI